MNRMHNPPHPGSILKDAIGDLGLTVTKFAAHVRVSRVTLSRILNESAGITPDVSIRIGQALGASPAFFFHLQTARDFWLATQEKRTPVKAVRTLKRAA